MKEEISCEACLGIREFPSVIMEHDVSFEKMIELGSFNAEQFPVNFPKRRKHPEETVFVLAEPKRFLTTEEVIEGLRSCHLRPATPSELLFFGANFLDGMEAHFLILALGYIWTEEKNCKIACLARYGGIKHLCLHPFVSKWMKSHRFLCVYDNHGSDLV